MSFSGTPPWILTVAGLLIAPIVSYVAAAKKFSGKINTTEADALWHESASIREDYRAQLAERDRRIDVLEAKIAMYEKRIDTLVERLTDCETKLREK